MNTTVGDAAYNSQNAEVLQGILGLSTEITARPNFELTLNEEGKEVILPDMMQDVYTNGLPETLYEEYKRRVKLDEFHRFQTAEVAAANLALRMERAHRTELLMSPLGIERAFRETEVPGRAGSLALCLTLGLTEVTSKSDRDIRGVMLQVTSPANLHNSNGFMIVDTANRISAERRGFPAGGLESPLISLPSPDNLEALKQGLEAFRSIDA